MNLESDENKAREEGRSSGMEIEGGGHWTLPFIGAEVDRGGRSRAE